MAGFFSLGRGGNNNNNHQDQDQHNSNNPPPPDHQIAPETLFWYKNEDVTAQPYKGFELWQQQEQLLQLLCSRFLLSLSLSLPPSLPPSEPRPRHRARGACRSSGISGFRFDRQRDRTVQEGPVVEEELQLLEGLSDQRRRFRPEEVALVRIRAELGVGGEDDGDGASDGVTVAVPQ
ncbi:unnamed protein product [Prunus armeniaca]|uniref:Uncharacterized protein n=1 Tax=Prunus armeniaca TaxID=36596 RepID=A0A6J5TH49_PRUAR|nr:unnamed protein product [Prunus armeniaca]CAB4293998.1 unnamed protein product [Prunus armeniaca]